MKNLLLHRSFWVLVHRYAGLYMAGFLVVAGLTGSILAFDHEISQWLNPEMTHVPVQDRPALDPFVLRDKALAILPNARINFMELNHEPGEIASFIFEPKSVAPAWTQIFRKNRSFSSLPVIHFKGFPAPE